MKNLLFKFIILLFLLNSCGSKEIQDKDYREVVLKYELIQNPNAAFLAEDIELVDIDTVSASLACSFITDQIYKRAQKYLNISGATPLVDSLINEEPKRFVDCVLKDESYVVIHYKFKLDDADWFRVFSEADSLVYFSEFRD